METTSPGVTQELPSDGRTARAVRTRTAIVDALLALLEEGDLQPTANRIADRAGISLRLIYHHFGDLEALFHAVAARQAERVAEIFEPVPDGLPLDERLLAFAQLRTSILEWLTPVRRASLLHEPFSEELMQAREAMHEIGRQQVMALFGDELDALPAGERESATAAFVAAANWSFWDSLRTAGLSVEHARATVHLTLTRLLHR